MNGRAVWRTVGPSVALLAAMLLAACAPASGPGTAQPAAKALSRTKVTVATVSDNWTVMMMPLLAQEKGWWKEYGLTEAEVKVVTPGATHVAAVIGGSIDYSVNLNTTGTALANTRGDKIYGIAGSTNKASYALYAKGIDSLEGLKGKTVATDSPGGAAEVVVVQILENRGIKRGEVTLVPVGGAVEERMRSMLSGATNAAILSVSDWPTLRAQGISKLATLDEISPEYQFALTVARGEMVEKHPDTTVAFLKGMIRAWQFIQDTNNDAEIARVLKQREIRVDDANWKELLSIQRTLMTKDGSVSLQGLDVVLKGEQDAKRLPADYKSDQLLRLDFLKQAQTELGIK